MTDLNNDSDSIVNSNLINTMHDMDLTRKISDDVTSRSSRRNYKINNINFMKKEMIFKSEKIRKNTSKSNECTNQYSESDNIEDLEGSCEGKKRKQATQESNVGEKIKSEKENVY